MPHVIKRQDKLKPKKPTEQRIEELETLVAEKDNIRAELQEKVDFVQVAVDEIILGGTL